MEIVDREREELLEATAVHVLAPAGTSLVRWTDQQRGDKENYQANFG